MTDSTSTNKRLSHLEAQFEGINSRLDAFRENQSEQNKKLDKILDERGNKTFNWGWFIGAVSLIMSIGSAVLIPLAGDIANNTTHIDAMRDNRWTSTEHHYFEDRMNKKHNDILTRLDKVASRTNQLEVLLSQIETISLLTKKEQDKRARLIYPPN